MSNKQENPLSLRWRDAMRARMGKLARWAFRKRETGGVMDPARKTRARNGRPQNAFARTVEGFLEMYGAGRPRADAREVLAEIGREIDRIWSGQAPPNWREALLAEEEADAADAVLQHRVMAGDRAMAPELARRMRTHRARLGPAIEALEGQA